MLPGDAPGFRSLDVLSNAVFPQSEVQITVMPVSKVFHAAGIEVFTFRSCAGAQVSSALLT